MGRTKKGQPVHGWVILDKPAGMGSTTCVSIVRRAFGAQKAGHAGTLDPDATGVLAVALGEATKTVPLIADAMKAYRFRVRFGAATSTDDASGEVIATSALRPSDDAIQAALPVFRGQIQQIPPQVSAVKVDGERAYDLARDGVEMDLAPRPLWVERLEVLDRPDPDHLDLEMVCGKGGYVRSIARDLGRALGCLGHVAWLRREWSGPFHARDAISPDALRALAEAGDLKGALHPLELALDGLARLDATPEGAVRLRNGNPGQVLGHLDWGTPAWAAFDGQAVALGHYRGGELHPNRVFNR